MSAPAVRIVEVGPRDGLQNEAAPVPVEARIRLIEDLADAGLKSIEAGAFVSPKWVPQMASTAEVLAGLKRRDGVTYSVLTPNMIGLDAAKAAGVTEVAVFGAASETFSQRNINCSIAESIERFEPVARAALAAGIRVRGYVSCVLGCPYEGDVPVAQVVKAARALSDMGCYEISLGDTIGVGTPRAARVMAAAVADAIGIERVAVHFHDTFGQALANILACLDDGVACVDSAVAGLGGCPYAKGASGNVATEDLVYMLNGLGVSTGVDLDRLARAGWAITDLLGKAPSSKVSLAIRAKTSAGTPS